VPELLLEVGFEEMPAPWLEGLGAQLQSKFAEAAVRELLEPREAKTYWTPRRLVLSATVAERQADREEPVWGPSLKAAKDAAGQWTQAAQGFAKKNGVSPDALQQGVKDPAKPDERNLLFVRKTAGRAASEVLPAVIGGVLRALSFPKRMSWDAWIDDGKGAFPFGRPIRWLVALLDGTVLPFVIYELTDGTKGKARVASGPATTGHRFLPRGAGGRHTIVRSLAELKDGLRRSCVLLDPRERLTRIDEGLRSAGLSGNENDFGLRKEWRDLVEYPTVLVGNVPAEFQSLPREVLETVLVHHQKYVPLPDQKGRIARFAAVTNGDGEAGDEIVRGMERVVVARFRDAAFFYAEDRKRKLADRVADLAGVTFHKGLGTYKDKADRLVRLVGRMGELGLLSPEDRKSAERAAWLAKADLTTPMVREFPELQGTMGGVYLEQEGEGSPIANAVRWHYHPLAIEASSAPSGALVSERIFAAVSLADKLDTLAGYFGLGLVPTGSSDPFGLRRAAQGATRVLIDFWKPAGNEKRPDLQKLIAAAVAGYPSATRPAAEVQSDLEAFFLDRLDYVAQARGFPAEEAQAAFGTTEVSALADPRDAFARLEALHRVRESAREDFASLASAFKRAKNILSQQNSAGSIDPALFDSEAERALHREVTALATANGDYDARLKSLSRLRAPVDRFFDDVLVMADDPRVRSNRIALLNQTLALFYRIADISKLGGQS
jgi:glycyl-tRNA synthetase beta chain